MPIHSPMMFLITSTLASTPGTRIVFTITVDNARIVKVSPRPSDNKIEFDISSHLRDYLLSDNFNPNNGTHFDAFEAPHVRYSVSIHEEYYNSGGVLMSGFQTTITNLVGTNIVLNRSEQLDFQDYKWMNLNTPGSAVANVLLNSQPKSTYYKDDVIFIHTVGLSYSAPIRFLMVEFNASGNQVASTPEIQLTNGALCKFLKIDFAQYTFNVNTAQVGIAFEADDYEFVTLMNRYTIIDQQCLPYQNFKILYLDKLGSYNTINLGYKSEEDLNIEKETFRKRIDPLNSADYSRGLQNYFTRADERYTLNTGNLNAEDMAKFEDLLLSTDVFLDVRNNPDPKFNEMNYVPLVINTNSMRRFKSENQDIPQFTIECQLGYELNVRRR